MADLYHRIPRSEMEKMERDGLGRIEFDEVGNAVWVPSNAPVSGRDIRQLLETSEFAFAPEETAERIHTIEANPLGLVKGYNPYASGMLNKKERRRKKDLRALSRWIQQKKAGPAPKR